MCRSYIIKNENKFSIYQQIIAVERKKKKKLQTGIVFRNQRRVTSHSCRKKGAVTATQNINTSYISEYNTICYY